VVTIVFSDLNLLNLSKESSWDGPQRPGQDHLLRRRHLPITANQTTSRLAVKPYVPVVSFSTA
jgi:hypothetical protein